MNPNPYPAGRWTTSPRSARTTKNRRGFRIQSESVTALRQAPLRELFWAAEESSLVDDARARIEAVLANAAAAFGAESILVTDAPMLPSPLSGELQAA
jgi:hypothetical protein